MTSYSFFLDYTILADHFELVIQEKREKYEGENHFPHGIVPYLERNE